MIDNVYILFWGGLFFLAIGLWMRKKDMNRIQLMDDKMTEKENNLYELYQALEEIMNQMHYIYQDKVEKNTSQENTVASQIKGGDINPVLEEEQVQYREEEDQHGEAIDQHKDLWNSKYRQVVQLKNQGYTHDEIAKELRIGQGEVKLILGLKG